MSDVVSYIVITICILLVGCCKYYGDINQLKYKLEFQRMLERQRFRRKPRPYNKNDINLNNNDNINNDDDNDDNISNINSIDNIETDYIQL